jgi:hypothetical protein
MKLNNFLSVRYIFYATLLLIPIFPLFSQNDSEEKDEDINKELPIQSDFTSEKYSVYSQGDKVFAITLGTAIPLVFTDKNYNVIPNNVDVGGMGSLSYFYFLTSNVFVGGELQASFSRTLGVNWLIMFPISAKTGYQFIYNKFEFPLSLAFGLTSEQYLSKSLITMFVKPELSVFFRFNPDWSFGLNAGFWWIPQWGTDNDTYGHFLEVSLSARYHF